MCDVVLVYATFLILPALVWPYVSTLFIAGVLYVKLLPHPVYTIILLLLPWQWHWEGTLVWLGAIYGHFYWEEAEKTGRRMWPLWRRINVLGPLSWLYGYRLVGEAVTSPVPLLYAVHPHGRLAGGAALAFLTNAGFSGHVVVSAIFFRVPFLLRELFLWHGAVSAEQETIGALLKRGPVALVPGGPLDRPMPSGFLRRTWFEWRRPVVPVWSSGDHALVWEWKPSILAPLRAWGHWALGIPFAVPCCLRPWWRTPPLVVRVGRPVDPAQYRDYETFETAYWSALEALK